MSTGTGAAPDDTAVDGGAEPLDGGDPSGLAQAEAERRLAAAGPNVLERQRPPSILATIWRSVTEPFLILLAAAGILAVLLGETRDGLFVLAGLLPIVVADVATAYRSERALEALRGAAAPVAHVVRDGVPGQVPAAEIVRGDLLLLAAGDVVPADARVVASYGMLVDTSVLTGEAIPILTSTVLDPADRPLAERRGVVHASTSVVGGRGRAVVTATGTATEVAAIAAQLGHRDPRRSPLQRELDRLVRILLVAAGVLIAITVGLGLLRGESIGVSLMAGISAAIAAIPEEPPVLLAVVLGLGAYRLLRRGVLVRVLSAQETLGAVDMVITDKTGTLTRNRLAVAGLMRPGAAIEPGERPALLLDALRAEDDAWTDGRHGSFTTALERALTESGVTWRLDPADLVDSTSPGDGRPYARVRMRTDAGTRDFVLGAVEAVLELMALGEAEREGWLALMTAHAGEGGRLLLLAEGDEDVLVPRAIVAFADPLRDDVAAAISVATQAGIRTVVVTGDHLATARAIADAVGLPAGLEITGAELAIRENDWLDANIARLRIVARALPEDKLRLVRRARAIGRTVAVTGDGVNDAPALQHADVGVAMGSGTAVAREAADLVLGDDSFATLMDGLRGGRRIVDNVRKGLVFLVSTHVALLGFILVATIGGIAQPLLPLQILWLELFIDLSSSVAFEREPEEPDAMHRPPRPPQRPLLQADTWLRIAGAGGFSAVAAFILLMTLPGPFEHVRWVAYSALVVAQAVRAYANRRLERRVVGLPMNGFLALAAAAAVAVQVAIPYVTPLATAFHATPLSGSEWVLVALIALAPALTAEVIRTLRPGHDWIA
ncbi:MAG: cation-translocating P-type ATPase [Chloroflexota bacterium]